MFDNEYIKVEASATEQLKRRDYVHGDVINPPFVPHRLLILFACPNMSVLINKGMHYGTKE